MWGHYWDTGREECLPHTKTETFLLASIVNAAMINIKQRDPGETSGLCLGVTMSWDNLVTVFRGRGSAGGRDYSSSTVITIIFNFR